jgi:hypothetical protein
MEGVIASGGLHGLTGGFNRNQDSLFLQPLSCTAVIMISPLAFGHNAPRRWLQGNRAESEFVERQHSSPFRRVAKGSDGVRQYR